MASASQKPSAPPPPPSAPSRRSGLTVRRLMFIVLCSAIAFMLLREFAIPILFFLLTLGPLVLVAGIVVVLVQRRRVQQDALLHVLTIGAEQNLPLAPGLEAFAGLCGRSFRWRTQALGRLLQNGMALPEALARAPGVLSRPAALLASVGWSQGNLTGGLREAQTAESNRRQFRGVFLPKIAYLGGMILVMQLVGGFMLYFITPKFEAIFTDFGLALPQITLFTIQLGHFLGRAPLGPLLLLTELILLIYLPLLLFGVVRWEPPFSGWLSWRRDSAAVFRSLAIGVEAGKPITDGLGLLGTLYPRGRVRRRLKRASTLVEQGADWLDALGRHGLINHNDRAVLESAQRAGNLSWALRMQADAHERRLGYRLQIWAELLFPVVVLTAGLCVALFAVGYMMPLIQLISRLAS